ncbi:extensin-2-like [Arachis duranensis]|uniref:Extensin-2-like n=1 Tax=Arachis duranensis TaxID=130453 RepID=A0A9C6WGM7_ARADU|nr:extensin-2-like [Arachis duranensis]
MVNYMIKISTFVPSTLFQFNKGNVDFNGNMYQGWNTPRWEESQGIDHSYWQQPPNTYSYNFPPNACQFNGYGDSFYENQPPPYAYESYPQHDAQPYSQASFYDPYPSYNQSSMPYSYDH